MPNDATSAIEFAQSKGQARREGKTNVTFADVAGCDEAVKQLNFVVEVRSHLHSIENVMQQGCSHRRGRTCMQPLTLI